MADKRPNRFGGAQERPKVRPGGSEPIIPIIEETLPIEPVTPPMVEETPVVNTAPESSVNPLADMIKKKDVGKACGFYLSLGSIKKLDKAAKQLKCSKSKALDLLIQKYL